jgi:hypothetical protein
MFVLIHSPSVGPSTWTPVADVLAADGYGVVVPSLRGVADAQPPFWPAVVEAVRAAVPPGDRPLVLVAHSNAGLFIPVIRRGLDRPVAASVFVDASLPAGSGSTPVAREEFLGFLRARVEADGRLPRWTDWWDDEDVTPLFPDERTREVVVADQSRLPLSYYEQHVPVPAGWADHRCGYLRFSAAYDAEAARARADGWAVADLPGEHLHQTVEPVATTDLIRHLAAAGTNLRTHVG